MAYSELIKNCYRIRAYLRSFYVYGFHHRGEFTQKCARSYGNEKRRVGSRLGDYMSFERDEDGKRVFRSVDSRSMPRNPLYRAFRAKSFTDRELTLHFHILDILKATDGLSITGIMKELDDRLLGFALDEMLDESTIRKKTQGVCGIGHFRVLRSPPTARVSGRAPFSCLSFPFSSLFFVLVVLMMVCVSRSQPPLLS